MAKGKHGHHGGAWKVAYADFVTAMMALFLVLWLTAQDQKIKEAIERAFRHPFASPTAGSSGIIQSTELPSITAEKGNFNSSAAVELNILRKIANDLLETLPNNPDNPMESTTNLELLPDGFRISFFDRSKKPIFEDGRAAFTTYGKWIFNTIAWDLARFTNSFQVELEGHTERGNTDRDSGYGSWELSADYANSARRLLMTNGIPDHQITKVAGFGDTVPFPGRDPKDSSNRRVAVRVRVKSEE
jgi:chemotaxis protein MotB